MNAPLTTIITPTIPARRDLLLGRCRPSVLAQTHPNIEHIIIQDGPSDDHDLGAELMATSRDGNVVKFIQTGRNWRQFSNGACVGAVPRVLGTYLAGGQFIGYLDDDDEYLPQHVEKLLALVNEKGVDWAYSIFKRFWSNGATDLIGSAVQYGSIGTPCIFHRAECLLHGNWGMDGYAEDFALVDNWTKRGLKHARLEEVTIHVHKQV